MGRLVGAVLVGAVMLGVAASPPAEGHDHTDDVEGRSQPVHTELLTEVHVVHTSTGAEIHVELTRPAPDAYPGLEVPTILHVSPYNNYGEDRSGAHLVREAVDDAGNEIGMRGWFPPRGYAWAAIDLRGSGASSGCFDHLGVDDQQDLADVVAWVVEQDWSTDRLGVIGHSYDGFSAATLAAVGGDAVRTAVISAGGASLYDHQFQKGVPFLAQWAGTSLYPALAATRLGDSDDRARDAQGTGCGFLSGSALDGAGQVTGQYGAWHAERDQRARLADRDLDIFVVQGLDDEQIRASAAEWFLTHRAPRPTDKLWIGPWTHREADHLNGRPGQWLGVLHAWFDRTLQERDVPTGPAVEAFFDSGEMVQMERWAPAPSFVTLHPDAGTMGLGFEAPTEAGTAPFVARGNLEGVRRVAGAGSTQLDGGALADGGLDFSSEPLPQDLVLVGLPQFDLHASIVGEVVHLVTTLYAVAPDGDERLLNTCALQPQLRDGIETFAPVVPGEVMALPLQCFPTSHHLPAGTVLRLHVGTGSLHHVGTFSAGTVVEVHTGPGASAYALPERPDLPVLAAPRTWR